METKIKFKWLVWRIVLSVLISCLMVAALYYVPQAILIMNSVEINTWILLAIGLGDAVLSSVIGYWVFSILVLEYINQ